MDSEKFARVLRCCPTHGKVADIVATELEMVEALRDQGLTWAQAAIGLKRAKILPKAVSGQTLRVYAARARAGQQSGQPMVQPARRAAPPATAPARKPTAPLPVAPPRRPVEVPPPAPAPASPTPTAPTEIAAAPVKPAATSNRTPGAIDLTGFGLMEDRAPRVPMDFGANHLSLQQFMAADEPAAIADVPAADPLDEEIAIEPAPDEYDVPDYPDADNYDVPDEPPPAPPPPQAAKDRPKIGKLF